MRYLSEVKNSRHKKALWGEGTKPTIGEKAINYDAYR